MSGLDRSVGALGAAASLTVGTGLGGVIALLMAAMFGTAGRLVGALLLVSLLTWLARRSTRMHPHRQTAALVLTGVVLAVLVAFLSWWSLREESLYSNDAIELRLVGEAMVGVFLVTLPLSWLQRGAVG